MKKALIVMSILYEHWKNMSEDNQSLTNHTEFPFVTEEIVDFHYFTYEGVKFRVQVMASHEDMARSLTSDIVTSLRETLEGLDEPLVGWGWEGEDIDDPKSLFRFCLNPNRIKYWGYSSAYLDLELDKELYPWILDQVVIGCSDSKEFKSAILNEWLVRKGYLPESEVKKLNIFSPKQMLLGDEQD